MTKVKAQQLGLMEAVEKPVSRTTTKRPPCDVCGAELVRADASWECPDGHVVDWDDDGNGVD